MNDQAIHLKEKENLSDLDEIFVAQNMQDCPSRRAVNQGVLDLAQRLSSLLEISFSGDDHNIQSALSFLRFYIDQHKQDQKLDGGFKQHNFERNSSLSRLQQKLCLSEMEFQLLILAGMAQEHEGFAEIFKSLHPSRQPYPTPALLAQLVCRQDAQRHTMALLLTQSALITLGFIRLSGDSPLLTQSMLIEANDWHAIISGNAQLNLLQPIQFEPCHAGLNTWLQNKNVIQAKYCLKAPQNSLVVLHSIDLQTSLNRAAVLAKNSQLEVLAVTISAKSDKAALTQLVRHCVISDSVPLLILEADEQNRDFSPTYLKGFNGCILVCARSGLNLTAFSYLTVELNIERLAVPDLLEMWKILLPEFASQANLLAARFPIEPHQAAHKTYAYQCLSEAGAKEANIHHVMSFFKQYSSGALPEGITRVTPKMDWLDLVVPAPQQEQLQEALNRLVLQHKVLDEWKFLHNRRGAKGVRLLFSGLPGTGKTLSAEVLANALNVDLLIVDLASVVSKWVGETEKNLAKVFSYAEQSQALLFFDEADAIFGKRTEVSDSHDRYANLETAYLLTRLEAYDGMAILATNYRNNIDSAFVRRLDYIVDFREPNGGDRERLWRCHVPATANVDPNVNYFQLANLYPMVGGEIRNAAVSAAYCAAQQEQSIQQEHFITAIRKEYEKTGKAFREVNPL